MTSIDEHVARAAALKHQMIQRIMGPDIPKHGADVGSLAHAEHPDGTSQMDRYEVSGVALIVFAYTDSSTQVLHFAGEAAAVAHFDLVAAQWERHDTTE